MEVDSGICRVQKVEILLAQKKGNLVIVIYAPPIFDKKKGKLEHNWEGPFVIEKVYSNVGYLVKTNKQWPNHSTHKNLFPKMYDPWKTYI